MMLLKRVRRTTEPLSDETVSIRAYELWQARGCPESDGYDDWQTAKEQLSAEQYPSEQRGLLGRIIARLRNRAA